MAESTTPLAVLPGEGTTIEGPRGGPLTYKLRGDQSDGALTAFEQEIAPQDGPPLHLHRNEDEVFHVLEGSLRFKLGDRIGDCAAGSFVFVPRGTPHTFQNTGEEMARILALFTPSGMERFFDRFAELEEFPEPEEFERLCRDSGMEILGPPLAVSDSP